KFVDDFNSEGHSRYFTAARTFLDGVSRAEQQSPCCSDKGLHDCLQVIAICAPQRIPNLRLSQTLYCCFDFFWVCWLIACMRVEPFTAPIAKGTVLNSGIDGNT